MANSIPYKANNKDEIGNSVPQTTEDPQAALAAAEARAAKAEEDEEIAQIQAENRTRSVRSPRFNRSMNTKDSDKGDFERLANKNPTVKILGGTASLTVFIICLSIAICGDIGGLAFNILPGIGGILSALIITPIGAINDFMFTKATGKKITGKKLGIILGCMAIEFLPIINALPGLTASILAIKASDIVDDKIQEITDKQ